MIWTWRTPNGTARRWSDTSTSIPFWNDNQDTTGGTIPFATTPVVRLRIARDSTASCSSFDPWLRDELARIERIRKVFAVPQAVWELRSPTYAPDRRQPWRDIARAQLTPRGHRDAPRRPCYRGTRGR